ncbi:uncharacterized protein A1O9_01804 [Exophiala aquamarina CBS 119918]|uniref:Cyclase n=1 Tax=Exophiala aquamarina CBS 119918 TaxID=1182545 RepID=A0A072PVE4_9EURO|nr:uncharacterized protein A1O9_01804 [Exophiala aquamarina CBS 119918]KEF63826.1 hypothetical protein A1O9_01804 [Exophiala aquamarina CBS 119918]
MPKQDIVEAVNGNESEETNFTKRVTEAPVLPSYADLPPVPNMPHGCTWGLWDRKGHQDELGTLNLLTPSTILAAKDEIQYGRSVAINWSLDNCETPHSNRKKPNHRILQLPDWIGHDDEIEMNTQSGSQWDGFREHPVAKWSKRGGIVGRGILLDYSRWAESQGIRYSPIERHAISEKDLEAVATWQGTDFREGDILLIRSGFVKWYKESSPQARRTGTVDGSSWAGVEGTKESVAWLWNKHFSCVGGDANVFEAWPAKDERYRLHDNLIALFGMPVGEMFDLEKLAEVCQQLNKWSFMFTSAPLNFPGGVASPPNAICIL